MAQLKVKQISDFVSAVAAVHNGAIGTDTVTGISVAKSEAISSSVSADVVILSSAKSYADVAEADAISTAAGDATTKADAALASAKTYADTAESDAIASANTEAGRLDAIVLSSAKSYADVAEADANTEAGRLDAIVLSSAKSHSNLQKDRIDALLLDSDATLDTFAEIKSFVDGLDTNDVDGLSAAISTGDSIAISTAVSADVVLLSSAKSYADVAEADAISAAGTAAVNYADGLAGNYDAAGAAAAALASAKTYADTAESDAIASANTEAGRLDAIVLSSAKSYADVAEADAVSTAAGDATSKANAAQSAAETNAATDATSKANAALVDGKSYTDGRETSILSTLRGEISGLAGTDKLEQTGTFGTVTTFSVATEIDLDNDDILVFVNGLQITDYTTTDGENFTVSGLGYDLESSDDIVVIGVAE